MQYIVYMSTAIKAFSDIELKELLTQSQKNNTRDNITGMLLYGQGSFVQVIEGDDEKIKETYQRILNDDRHKGIIELAQGTLEKRNFPDWSMGFNTLSPVEFAQFDSFIVSPNVNLFKYGTHPALTILKTFVKSNF